MSKIFAAYAGISDPGDLISEFEEAKDAQDMEEARIQGREAQSKIVRSKNEDFLKLTELGNDGLLSIVADGSGSGNAGFQPAGIIANNIAKSIKRLYARDKKALFEHMPVFLEEACLAANEALVAFKIGNEELYGGFASTVTGFLLHRSGNACLFHAGNSRLYFIRDGKILQVTKDQTEGQALLDKGIFKSDEEYYMSAERLKLRNGLGVFADPYVVTGKFVMKQSDVAVLTTDGVHYSINQDAIRDTVLASQSPDQACQLIVEESLKMNSYYKDNITVAVVQYLGGE